MNLREVTFSDFQSYRTETTVRLDPALTLIAGRNDVGKSALLRALRVAAEPQDGLGPGFHISFTWLVSQEELRSAARGQQWSPPIDEWLSAHDEYTLKADFVRGAEDPSTRLTYRRLEVPELNAVAEGQAGAVGGWKTGAFEGRSTGAEAIALAARRFAGMVSFVTPRRVELGRQGIDPQDSLAPDARNLTNVIAYLVQNEGATTFPRLEAFVQEAFPEIRTVRSVLTGMESGRAQQNELHVLYRGREGTPIPLRLCGTGIEQMLALATGVYTAATPRLFLIDEPQAYLHPHAERSLLRLFDENPQHQYVIATHSSVFLNSRPLSHARLITIADGVSKIADVFSPAALLSEIGVNAADLWLADSLLWVEGASDVGVLETIIQAMIGSKSRGVAVRAMPEASRFSSRSRARAEQTFRFCEAVLDAVAPMPIRTLFLFDRDDKSDGLCEEIIAASRGRARFLPVRELENLFLVPEVIAKALAQRCEILGFTAPSITEVRHAFQQLLENTDDRQLYPHRPIDNEEATSVVAASHVLDRLYWDFTKSRYDKVEDGSALASLCLEAGISLHPLREVLEELLA
jgi:predicted ATPase